MLGDRIRALRADHNMTQTNLAERVGVTASYISMLERGLVDPSLSTLRKISQVFSLPMSALIDEAEDDNAVVVFKEGTGRQLWAKDHTLYEYRTPRSITARGDIEVLRSEIAAGEYDFGEMICHDQVECTYVLEGNLQVITRAGVYHLAAGDSIYLKKNIPHRFYNEGKGVLKLLSCLGPQDI